VERGSIFMIGPGRQLTSPRHCRRAYGGILLYLAGPKCKLILCQKSLLL